MDKLSQSHVHMKDVEHVKRTLESMINDGDEKLQIVADFDFTLSKYTSNGKRCSGCHNVLEEGHLLSESYKTAAKKLRDTYFPLEMNPKLSIEEKIPYMVEWWTKAHELLEQCELSKHYIRNMVEHSTARLRDNCCWLFDELNKANVPLLIFSAGIGDVLEEIIHHQATFHDNMKVVSNYMRFDEAGKMIGFQGDIIHVYNKNESAIHKSDYFQKLEHRHNIILMGDSLGDLHMADGVTNVENKLTIGFLNVNVEDSLELYKRKFDIVIVQDETMDVVNSILKKVLKNSD